MKKILPVIVLFIFLNINQAYATYDPLGVPNNKIGIHILFPDELSKAKELVNSNNGDWGYVTIPIQSTDRDVKKWQVFMNSCRQNHIIPIIRLATEGDYFTQGSWREPEDYDILDFANFLNSLIWPTKNRYIIVFNEVNRADEWGGKANPDHYAKLLSYASTVFKSKNKDFFLISSGMDNASTTKNDTYDQFDFMTQMNVSVPGIFNQIDGLSSHSYPNPGFTADPSVPTSENVTSFLYEKEHIKDLGGKDLPVFITETGWDHQKLSEEKVANYYKETFEKVWNDPSIVAVTPFLLNSGPGPFEKFSFIKNNGDKNEIFKMFQSFSKTRGKPIVTKDSIVLGESITPRDLPTVNFATEPTDPKEKVFKQLLKWTANMF